METVFATTEKKYLVSFRIPSLTDQETHQQVFSGMGSAAYRQALLQWEDFRIELENQSGYEVVFLRVKEL